MSYPPGYEDPSRQALVRCLVGGSQALKVNSGGAAKRKSIRISPDLRYIVWEPSKRGSASAKFGAWRGAARARDRGDGGGRANANTHPHTHITPLGSGPGPRGLRAPGALWAAPAVCQRV